VAPCTVKQNVIAWKLPVVHQLEQESRTPRCT
jgi:hypothetical protein